MGRVQSSLVLQDRMTKVLSRINRAMELTIDSFEAVQKASGKSFDTKSITAVREAIGASKASLDEIEQSYKKIDQSNKSCEKSQEKLNSSIKKGSGAAEGLLNKITSIAATYMSFSAVKGFISDSLDAADIQLSAQVQLNTVMGNMGTLDYYEDVLAKASEIQSKGIYGDEAMIAGAAELSTYFSDGEAILSMMGTLSDYAMGMSGGGEIDSKAMVDYATGIGKIMTGSFDAMTKKGFEFTDSQKAIIEGTATNAQIVETLGEEYLGLSGDMQAAAVINNVIAEGWDGLYEAMSNTPEGKIIQLNNALGDIKESVGVGIYPEVLNLVTLIMDNLPAIENIALNIATIISAIINFIALIVQTVSAIVPSVGNVQGAFNNLKPVIAAVAAIGALLGLRMVASALKSAAAWGLAHLPLLLIIAVIAGIIGIAMKMGVTFRQVCETIGGVFGVLFSVLYNTFVVPLWNGFAMIANFFANVFNDPIAAIKIAFYDMALTILGYVRSMAEALETLVNKIPGVSINITSGIDEWYSKLERAQQTIKDESEWVEVVKKMDYMDAEDAWDVGHDFGGGVADTLEGLFDKDLLGGMDDYTDEGDPIGYGGVLDNISDNTEETSQNTGKNTEDLSYLRDIAEREAINRFTTAEVKIDMSGMSNRIDSNMDLDGVLTTLTEGFAEALETAAEGVHA